MLRLIEEGADVNCTSCSDVHAEKDITSAHPNYVHANADNANETLLHIAVSIKNTPEEIVMKLISPQNINMMNSAGETVLRRAIRAERWDLVLPLVQRGAEVDPVTMKTPFQVVLGEKCPTVPVEIVRCLISPHNINRELYFGMTALCTVVGTRRWDLVPLLIQHGADVNDVDRYNNTPLHLALLKDAPSNVVPHLVSVENINMKDSLDNTALHIAADHWRCDLVPVLIQHGAGVNHVDRYNNTPLHQALLKDAPSNVVPHLVSAVNINIRDSQDNTALHIAADHQRWDLVPVLIQHGAYVNIVNRWTDETPLHLALLKEVPSNILVQLVSAENINMKDSQDHFTALHRAVTSCRWDLVPVLIQSGADVNVVDSKGRAPIHLAVWKDVPSHLLPQLASAENVIMRDMTGQTCLDIADHAMRASQEQNRKTVTLLVEYGGMSIDKFLRLGFCPCGLHTRLNSLPRKFLLQHLPTDTSYSHVKFHLKSGRLNLKIKNHWVSVFDRGEDADEEVTMVNAMLNLLHGITLVKVDLSVEDNVVIGCNQNIIAQIRQILEHFEQESHNPASMSKLCILTIRQHLPMKADANFARLGLPTRLLCLVKHEKLAEEIQFMFRGSRSLCLY